MILALFAAAVLVAYPVTSFARPRVRARRVRLTSPASNGARRPSLAETHTYAPADRW